tara:strand:- start:894 stop:1229 length:336 start_codon:yes stop_codon:yes gene_type:complete
MSHIKTHDLYNVVHGDNIRMVVDDGDDGEKTLVVKSLLVNRQQQKHCQIFAHAENMGSLASSNTKVYNCTINTIIPGVNSTDFNVKANVGNTSQTLVLKTVKSQNNECVIS